MIDKFVPYMFVKICDVGSFDNGRIGIVIRNDRLVLLIPKFNYIFTSEDLVSIPDKSEITFEHKLALRVVKDILDLNNLSELSITNVGKTFNGIIKTYAEYKAGGLYA